MPAVVLVLAACLAGIHLATTQLRLQDASASAARSLARGEPHRLDAHVPGASATTTRSGGLVCVTAMMTVPLAGGLIGSLDLAARSCAAAQP